MTRCAAVFAATLIATIAPGLATAQEGGDTAALRERVGTYQKVWNTRDATRVAAFFSEDADLVMGNLPRVRGRGAIETLWRAYFERQEPGRQGTFDVLSARLLAPDVALVNVASTTGGAGPGGEALPIRRARGTWLLRSEGGEWIIVAMQALPGEEDRVELVPSLEAARSLRPRLRAFVAAYEDTFDRHDPEALSAFYRDDADILVRNGPLIHGAPAIREWWRTYFSQPRPYRVLLVIQEIEMLSDRVALLNLAVTGALDEATDALTPVRRARATWVVVREDGEWKIAALRMLPGEDDRVIRHLE